MASKSDTSHKFGTTEEAKNKQLFVGKTSDCPKKSPNTRCGNIFFDTVPFSGIVGGISDKILNKETVANTSFSLLPQKWDVFSTTPSKLNGSRESKTLNEEL